MRIVEESQLRPGTIEVSWMWLPTFIGQNTGLLKELDAVLTKQFPPPFDATEEKLDEISKFVIGWLAEKHKIPGLGQYLHAIEHVGEEHAELMSAVGGLVREMMKPGVDWEAVDQGKEVLDKKTGILIKKVGDPVKGVR